MNTTVIEFQDVTRAYPRGVVGVRDLDLAITEGTSYGLLGRNGAGKSTALNLVMGMLRPDAGSVRVFGRDPLLEGEVVKAQVGYVAEDQVLPSGLTAADVFGLHRSLYAGWDDALERRLVKDLGLPCNRPLGSLSKGQRRQAAVVAAVAHRPRLLVLDEPGGGLDPVVRREFLEMVIELLSEEGSTVVFSSHLLGEVERVAGRIGILHEGRLLIESDLDGLAERSCRVLVELQDARPLQSPPGCVRARERGSSWTLTFLCSPGEARQRVRDALGLEVRQALSVSLEDLFVDLVEDRP